MKIKFSRHAKRRAKLYKIPESIIIHILTGMNIRQGEHEIIKKVAGFGYPLKVVVTVEKDVIMIVTTYPLKKERKK